MAARQGHLELLQWVLGQQPPCPWNASTCRLAVERGHLQVLQWVQAQQPPCPWDKETCRLAAERRNMAVLRWLWVPAAPLPLASEVLPEHCAGVQHISVCTGPKELRSGLAQAEANILSIHNYERLALRAGLLLSHGCGGGPPRPDNGRPPGHPGPIWRPARSVAPGPSEHVRGRDGDGRLCGGHDGASPGNSFSVAPLPTGRRHPAAY